ncbi:MAG: hypothetical protein KME42_03365 [Tildeniella nuda ZEHNDER 1965/U140]|nr:hypothetical protein [Tildeniella nuda ZEHNDER 1965/U140]
MSSQIAAAAFAIVTSAIAVLSFWGDFIAAAICTERLLLSTVQQGS